MWEAPIYMVLTLTEPVTMGRAGNTTSHTHRASSFSYLASFETRTMFTDEPSKTDWSSLGDQTGWWGLTRVVLLTETYRRKNWQKLLMTGKERLSNDDIKVREQKDSAFSSQMVTLSLSHALAPWPPNAKVSQLGHSAWEWGLHIPSFPSPQGFLC